MNDEENKVVFILSPDSDQLINSTYLDEALFVDATDAGDAQL
jgi:hypothetical protein